MNGSAQASAQGENLLSIQQNCRSLLHHARYKSTLRWQQFVVAPLHQGTDWKEEKWTDLCWQEVFSVCSAPHMAETIERWVRRKEWKIQEEENEKRERAHSGKLDGAISGESNGGNADEMKLPILVFSRLVHPKTFGREIIGREERSWCNDGKTVSGWELGCRGSCKSPCQSARTKSCILTIGQNISCQCTNAQEDEFVSDVGQTNTSGKIKVWKLAGRHE